MQTDYFLFSDPLTQEEVFTIFCKSFAEQSVPSAELSAVGAKLGVKRDPSELYPPDDPPRPSRPKASSGPSTFKQERRKKVQSNIRDRASQLLARQHQECVSCEDVFFN